ncbi:uncharacterized protein LOC121405177 [Drosophila obscura]|uniref:uncharacterized protein LOC121405177 n=1 Tax=Drosophila obscura TaxID=7282 RepID=UPI001BB1DDA4|nr:uncharacterized protein LOC121405177 [Drosophila obscura]
MQAAVQEALGSTAEVRSLTETAIIEVKDIDEVSTQEEVLAELTEQAGVAINEAQTLTLKVSPTVAATLIGKGRIRLGWGYCRIRPKTTPRRCFKCMEFGHIATNCKSAQDFSKCCYNCSETDHQAKDCKAQPTCILCKRHRARDTKHQTTSSRCPQYQKAIQQMRDR